MEYLVAGQGNDVEFRSKQSSPRAKRRIHKFPSVSQPMESPNEVGGDMKTYKWITISAALAITAVEAMVFNHETAAAAPDTASLSTTARPANATASNLQWLRQEVESSPPQGRTHKPERAQP